MKTCPQGHETTLRSGCPECRANRPRRKRLSRPNQRRHMLAAQRKRNAARYVHKRALP